MRLKTFIGQSMQQVMAQIRAELGSEAVIISALQEKNGVRITAALENVEPINLTATPPTPAVSSLDDFMRLLEYQRLPRDISETILTRVSELEVGVVSAGPIKILESLFSFSPLPHPWAAKGGTAHPFMFVGPTGAGKTLTTAKLAAEYILAGWRVAILTTDGEKAGAHAQLTRFAEALQTPLSFVEDAESLQYYLENEYAETLVFVDTTGLNPYSTQDLERLSEFVAVLRHPPTLVMPSGLDVYEAIDLADAVKNLGVTRFIHSKIDCCQRFSSMLGVMSQSELQLASVGCGPELGSRLKPASAALMAELLQRHLPAEEHADNQNLSSSSVPQFQEARL